MNSRKWRNVLTVLTVTSTLYGTLVPQITMAATASKATTADLLNKASKEMGMSTTVLQQYMSKGYSLSDLRVANAIAKNSRSDFDKTLANLRKKLVTSSKQLKAPANKLQYPAGKKPSGKLVDKKITQTTPSMTAMTTDPADTAPTVTEQMEQAPYTVSLSDSNVSPLTGAASLEVKEMTLYGKNGLDFDLVRSYSSDAAQFYDFNKSSLTPSYTEGLYMLGSGWSWNLSSIETDPHTKKKYLHYAGSGSYLISGTTTLTLPSYPWKDLTIAANTSVTVGTNTSAYVVTSTKDGKMQYFDTKGRLIEIVDKYGNWIQFNWTKVDLYDEGLADITNNIGNKISFKYDYGASITISQGKQTVVLSQDVMNAYGTHVYMTGETDAVGRKTMYGYQVGDALYSMTSTTPTNDNPYMLLNEVDHPTGAKTIFTYEGTPVTRKTSSTSSDQVWRIQSVENQVTYTDGSTQSKNKSTFTYTGDMGSSVGTTLTVSTNVNNGLTNKSYEYKRLYASANTSLGYVFYNTKTTETDTATTPTSKIVTNTYDTTKGRPMPTSILTQFKKGTTTSTGSTSTMTFDDYANVLTTTNPAGTKTTYSYDANTHLLSQESTPISTTETVVKTYSRNALGDITSEVTKDQVKSGTTTTETVLTTKNYDFDSTTHNQVGEHVIDNGQDIFTTYGYSSDEKYSSAYLTSKTVHNVTDANNQTSDVVTTYDYDTDAGMLTDVQDGLGNKTHYDYDNVGRLTAQTNPDGSKITLAYHDVDATAPENSVEEMDETGTKKKMVYDPFGQKMEADIYSGGAFTKSATFSYDNNSRLVAEGDINPATNNPLTTTDFDAFNRKVKTTNPDLSAVTYSYDDLNYAVTTAQSDQTTKSTYDKMGNETLKELVRSTDAPDLTTNTYDSFNNLVSTKDANGKVTSYKYDALNHLTSVTDANQNTTQYTYDARGNVTTITYPGGGKMQKKYDEMSHVIQQTDPSGKVQYFFYDAAGNLIQQTDRKGQSINMEYNARNLLKKKTSGNTVISFEYDASGHRTKMSDETGDTSYTYNTLGQLATVTTPDEKTMSYTYDAVGNVATMQDPFGKTTTYTMDGENHLQSVSTGSSKPDAQYQFNPSGTVSQVTEGNGMNVSYSYNEFKNVTNEVQKNAANTTMNTFAYNYDLNSNQTSKTENGTTSTMGYDSMNQVISNSQFNETYTYDKQGNRLTQQSDNPAEPNLASYTYDELNQLKTVTTADGKVVSYKYNGDGLMVERTVNDVTTRYYYDGDKIIAEANVTSDGVTLTARYIRGNDGELVAREDANGNKAYYLHNAHGDITEMRDSNGNVLNKYTYDIWGRPLTTQETVANPFRYSGEYWDADTNLQYLRARWYDPSSGRFINEDTVQGDTKDPATLNLYTYVKNNPVKYWDPSGHCEADNNGNCDRSNTSTPGNQHASANLIDFLEDYEKLALYSYNDGYGNPTIGYGHVITDKDPDYSNGITKSQAEAILQADLNFAEDTVNNFVAANHLVLSQNQFDALVSLVYNNGPQALELGYSTIANMLVSGKKYSEEQWRDEFVDWAHVDGKIDPGLYNRKMDEFQIFWSGDYQRNYWKK